MLCLDFRHGMLATAWMLLTPSHRVMSIVQSPLTASDTTSTSACWTVTVVTFRIIPAISVIFTPGSAVPATVNIAVLTGRVGDAVVMTGLADCTGGVITGAGTVDVQCDHNRYWGALMDLCLDFRPVCSPLPGCC